jgi:mRNA interferase RelE/StbE
VPYTVVLKRSAERELDALPRGIRDRLVQHLLTLEQEPRPRGSRKLQGLSGRRLRVGDYRILYEVDDTEAKVTVLAVGHRREVCR